MLEGRCNCAYFTDEATESLTSQESSSKRAIYNPDLQKLSASRSFVPNLSDLERKKKKKNDTLCQSNKFSWIFQGIFQGN